jgi:hypothetical protein
MRTQIVRGSATHHEVTGARCPGGAYFGRLAVTGYVTSVLPAGLITVFVT